MAVGKKIFEPDEIRKTIQALKDYEELFEVRCLEAHPVMVCCRSLNILIFTL